MKRGDNKLRRLTALWAERAGTAFAPPEGWELPFLANSETSPITRGAGTRRLRSWERRHGFAMPESLRSWLLLSDGLRGPGGPLIHPITAIGPMIPFARVPDLVVQPESWFELGNPGPETVCIDLGYQINNDCPIFASGDDESGTRPRIIAQSFSAWLLRVLEEGGSEYWLDPAFRSLGDPWAEHCRNAPTPHLPERLQPMAKRALPLMHPDADDRSVAAKLGVTRGDVEALFRHLQHLPTR